MCCNPQNREQLRFVVVSRTKRLIATGKLPTDFCVGGAYTEFGPKIPSPQRKRPIRNFIILTRFPPSRNSAIALFRSLVSVDDVVGAKDKGERLVAFCILAILSLRTAMSCTFHCCLVYISPGKINTGNNHSAESASLVFSNELLICEYLRGFYT